MVVRYLHKHILLSVCLSVLPSSYAYTHLCLCVCCEVKQMHEHVHLDSIHYFSFPHFIVASFQFLFIVIAAYFLDHYVLFPFTFSPCTYKKELQVCDCGESGSSTGPLLVGILGGLIIIGFWTWTIRATWRR